MLIQLISAPCGLILQETSLDLLSWQVKGSKTGVELVLCHFYHIILSKANQRAWPDSGDREIDPFPDALQKAGLQKCHYWGYSVQCNYAASV